MKKLLFMGIAGMVNWGISYPMDLVKSIIQCDDGRESLRIRDVVRDGYQRLGFRFFYQGISATFLHSFPLHILLLLTYEVLNDIN